MLAVGSEGKLQMSASRYMVDVDQRLSNCFISRACKLTKITMDRHLKRILLFRCFITRSAWNPNRKQPVHSSYLWMQLFGGEKEIIPLFSQASLEAPQGSVGVSKSHFHN